MKTHFLLALALALPLAAQVKITQSADIVKVEIDGKPYADFVMGDTAANKPYLFPLRTATGKIITRHFPMEKVEGEVYDHQHHRGLWFSHGDVNGIDFWANESSYKKGKLGKIVLKKLNGIKSGAKSGSINATFNWNDPEGKTLLTEDRVMTFYSDPKLRTIDVDVKLTAAGAPVKFGDTKEGVFAIRLATPLDEKHTGKMVSSDGKAGEKQVWGKAFPWVDYSGQIDGETVGVAILDNPSNPRAPTHWHARSYGLFAANIWGMHDFTNDKTQDGSMTLDPGKSMRFRYRVVVHSGDTAAADIATFYKQYVK
jgi:hypothetical protein